MVKTVVQDKKGRMSWAQELNSARCSFSGLVRSHFALVFVLKDALMGANPSGTVGPQRTESIEDGDS
jgi:hypothetical protein